MSVVADGFNMALTTLRHGPPNIERQVPGVYGYWPYPYSTLQAYTGLDYSMYRLVDWVDGLDPYLASVLVSYLYMVCYNTYILI